MKRTIVNLELKTHYNEKRPVGYAATKLPPGVTPANRSTSGS